MQCTLNVYGSDAVVQWGEWRGRGKHAAEKRELICVTHRQAETDWSSSGRRSLSDSRSNTAKTETFDVFFKFSVSVRTRHT